MVRRRYPVSALKEILRWLQSAKACWAKRRGQGGFLKVFQLPHPVAARCQLQHQTGDVLLQPRFRRSDRLFVSARPMSPSTEELKLSITGRASGPLLPPRRHHPTLSGCFLQVRVGVRRFDNSAPIQTNQPRGSKSVLLRHPQSPPSVVGTIRFEVNRSSCHAGTW